MSETSAAHTERKRKRTVEDGKVITNVPPEVGLYIAQQAEDMGIAGATMARILIIEGLKARGLTLDVLRKALVDETADDLVVAAAS